MKKLALLLLLIIICAPFAKSVTLDYNLIDPHPIDGVNGVDIKRNANGIYHLIRYMDASDQRPRIEHYDLSGNLVGTYTDLAWGTGVQLVPVSLQLDNAGNVWMLTNLYTSIWGGTTEVIIYKLDKFLTNATVTNFSPYTSNNYDRLAVGMELDGTTGLVITCNKDSVAHPSNKFMSAFKMSLSGLGLWNYDYHLPLNFISDAKCMAVKGGKVYMGGLRSTQNWGSDAAIICLRTTNGTLVWQSSYHYSTNMYTDQITGLAIDNSGNCYATGSTAKASSNNLYFNNIMLKYTSTGVLSWAKLYAPTIYGVGWNNDLAYRWIVLDNASNAYFLSQLSTAMGFKARLGKYDTAGNLKWSKIIKSTLQRDEFSVDLKISSTNNIYVATTVYPPNNNTQLYRYDTLGALKEIDTTAIRPVAMTLATSGSKILISGYTIDPNGHDHYAFSSFSQSPLRMMEEEENINKPSLTCYPSPAFDFIHIKTDADMQNAQLTITNMNGSVVRHQPMEDSENTIPVGDLPNGIYVVMVANEANRIIKKFMVQH